MNEAGEVVIQGKVVQGLRAAQHTLTLQIPLIAVEFAEIARCHRGSVNLQLERPLEIVNHDHETGLISWAGPPGEQFGFLRINLEFPIGGVWHTAWIYTPYGSPHRQNRYQVEVIAHKIENIDYGCACRIHIPRKPLESTDVIRI